MLGFLRTMPDSKPQVTWEGITRTDVQKGKLSISLEHITARARMICGSPRIQQLDDSLFLLS
jgi:hypothetical protein